ncbi:hypothetical protein F971_03119 [Acinetobacter vivianii]|uniref:Helix-turn-helix domain-containing protein n=1 Tax=Acinetobacter vivianii TaxID=1776742 RepID=N8UWR4_9GAMM|nr:hypothetical protein [Acinetobacter vivianii]ENU92026.1 hypothetical protein F971_03119 [Acinetobacter vivianii]
MDIAAESQWLPLIYEEMQKLKAQNVDLHHEIKELKKKVTPLSLTVDTNEAAFMLGVTCQTIRKWQTEGKMPKLVSKEGQNFAWSRSSIENLAKGINKGGRKRKNA